MTHAPGSPRRSGRSCATAIVAAGFLALAAPAQSQTDLGKDFDTSLPIEITADSLEVQQELQTAIFRGAVDATQGELNLRADQLTVHYRTGDDGKNSVARIDADGNVFLSSPTEIAQGNKGVYDIDSDTMELVGSVVLTRGENVIRGDRLTLNLATGESKMQSAGTSTGERQRVKALFVPKSEPQ